VDCVNEKVRSRKNPAGPLGRLWCRVPPRPSIKISRLNIPALSRLNSVLPVPSPPFHILSSPRTAYGNQIDTMASPLSLTRNVLRPASRHILATQLRTLPVASSRYYSNQPAQSPGELGVGELQGAKFKIEPLRRVGEDDKTKRARLICMLADSPTLTCRWHASTEKNKK
jgi:hypothetical protein